MLGYEKGIDIIVDGKIVNLKREQIKEVTTFGNACELQERIQTVTMPNTYDDNISLNLAEAATSIAETPIKYFDPYVKIAINDGFFKEK